ncbi:MAG: acetyl-CoA carboxylase biotin carboxyl carrier protein [Endomicrobiia bacterium]|nr:MAG: acetyl-CoA carboxylase biotin carboxyl carrier protein [Endomicrobiia bacterium]
MSGNIIEKVKSLYEIMKDEKIQELEINSKEHKIYIKRKYYDDKHDSSDDDCTVIQKNVKKLKSLGSNKDQKESVAVSSIVPNETIKSPIMGVFYRSPSPSSAVFVNEGDIVEVGRTICIVEAMKVMNEIKTTFKTKILKILIENGKSVNLNQELFEVEKV